MQSAYSAYDISLALAITERAVRKRAQKEKWVIGKESCVGGRKIHYPFKLLPDEVQLAVSKWCQNRETAVVKSDQNSPTIYNDVRPLNQAQVNKGMMKADLLRLYHQHMKKAGYGNTAKMRDEFMRAYNSGIAYPEIYNVIGKVSYKTVEGWARKISKKGGDTLCLTDRRGYWRNGQKKITPEQEEILLRCALHPNKPKIAEVIRMAHAIMNTRGIPNGHSDSTYRRWINDWVSRNHHIWTFNREGAKAWNDKCAYYIERDYSLINVGDILVADGHTLNFEILNPWTGKPKRMTLILFIDMKSSTPLGWEIMPTEDTQAISSALRRAILRLGKYPKVVYLDNGRAFKSRFFKGCNFEEAGFAGLYERLGIETIFAWAYHGQSKTVERFFGTFAELERWCPTYTGTSIEDKPPRMMRGEKLHRRVYEKATKGACLTMDQAHQAIASWFDNYVQRPQKGHLKGQAPIELFLDQKGPGVDPSELRYLMMSIEIRTIHRNGITIFGQNYYDPALYGRRHPVVVRYDLQNKDAVYIFEKSGEYLCEARPVEKVHPAANILGNEKDRELLRKHIELKRHLEKDASISARAFLENEIMPEHHRMLESHGVTLEGPQKAEVKQLPDRLSEADEREILKEAQAVEVVSEELSNVEPLPEVVDETANAFSKLSNMSEMDRYEKLVEYEVRGWLIPKQYQAFMSYYEMTTEYEKYQDYFEDARARAAVMYQAADS